MFAESVTKITSMQKRHIALRAEVIAQAERGEFILTEFLCEEKEPIRTDVQMVIDGHAINGASPVVDSALKIPMPDVRLMTIRPGDSIKVKRVVARRAPGTRNIIEKREAVDLGNDVLLDHATARDVLSTRGYPVRNIRTKGAKQGTVVEVGWLEREVARRDSQGNPDCLPEIREMYETLKPRIEKKTAKAQPAGRPA